MGGNAIAIRTLVKDWISYDATIYTDGAATHGNTMVVSVSLSPLAPSEPRVHCQCTILAGKWCLSFEAEENVM